LYRIKSIFFISRNIDCAITMEGSLKHGGISLEEDTLVVAANKSWILTNHEAQQKV